MPPPLQPPPPYSIIAPGGSSPPVYPINAPGGSSPPIYPISAPGGSSPPIYPINAPGGSSPPIYPINAPGGSSPPIYPINAPGSGAPDFISVPIDRLPDFDPDTARVLTVTYSILGSETVSRVPLQRATLSFALSLHVPMYQPSLHYPLMQFLSLSSGSQWQQLKAGLIDAIAYATSLEAAQVSLSVLEPLS
jgi:hypothetical protein